MIACHLEGDNNNILIPYEVNNSFFLTLEIIIKEGELDLPELNIAAPDFGRGIEFSGEKLDQLIKDYEVIENNLDYIESVIPLPEMVGQFDGHIFPGYMNSFEYDNFVEVGKGGGLYFSQKELLYLIGLLKKKAKEAREMGETLCFTGD